MYAAELGLQVGASSPGVAADADLMGPPGDVDALCRDAGVIAEIPFSVTVAAATHTRMLEYDC